MPITQSNTTFTFFYFVFFSSIKGQTFIKIPQLFILIISSSHRYCLNLIVCN